MIIKVNDNGTIKSCNILDISDIPTKISDLTDDSGHYTKPSGGIPASDLADGVVPVEDVQVNGTSIVEDGVANVPIMDINQFGIAQLSNNGVTIDSTGALRTIPAGDGSIKGGTTNYNVIVPRTQHQATFYGLAKAAGDTTQSSSSNAVGAYTDEAKVAIQKMLGIYEAPWELINEETFTNVEEADHIITVDANGEPLELTDVAILFETPQQATESKWGGVVGIHIWTTATTTRTPRFECGSYTQAVNAVAHIASVHMRQNGNSVEMYRAANTTVSNTGTLGYRVAIGLPGLYDASTDRIFFSLTQGTVYADWIKIEKVTGTGHYKLYGKRKWQ